MIDYKTVENRHETEQILALQAENLAKGLTVEEIAAQGFVTVHHDPIVLWEMQQTSPSVIATSGGELAGYCLMMPRSFAPRIPELVPMFALLNTLSWQGQPLSTGRWFVMGQVCVAKAFRSQGVFDGMYQHLKTVYAPHFDWVITEIAVRNARSCRAHERVGFEIMHRYTDPVSGEDWLVVIWDWTKS